MKEKTIFIEKNIKIPEHLKSVKGMIHRRSKYNWADMRIGDSFVTSVSVSGILSAARLWVKRNKNKRVFVATSVLSHPKRTRVWRLK